HRFNIGSKSLEHKKWIHCLESIMSIIFCTAVSEYKQNLLDKSTMNCLQQSLILFESVINLRWFLRASNILFFIKIYAFKSKCPKVIIPFHSCSTQSQLVVSVIFQSLLERYFPEYTVGAHINKTAKYILWHFMQAN
ncbi:hypothetical protein PILCRDRAFT_785020, partial [Piloderma croceum F 1598]